MTARTDYAPDLNGYAIGLPFPLESIFTVGWIDREHAFSQGSVPANFTARLWTLVLRRTPTFDLHANVMRGIEPCDFCDEEVWVKDEDGQAVPLGMSEVWIPGNGRWYACPSLIVHYVNEHDYKPPQEFIEAALAVNLAATLNAQAEYDRALRLTMAHRDARGAGRSES